MHTVWKGAISFGLVHVPVKMFSATEDKDISLRYIHKECGSPLSYVRKCPVCDKEVAWEEIGKGYEYEKGKFVLFDKEELDQLTDESSKSITILDFVDLTEIDPIYFQKPITYLRIRLGQMHIGFLWRPCVKLEKLASPKYRFVPKAVWLLFVCWRIASPSRLFFILMKCDRSRKCLACPKQGR